MDVVEILKELVSINSVNPFQVEQEGELYCPETWKVWGNEQEIARYLERKLVESGFKVTLQPVHENSQGNACCNVIGEKGTGDHAILFYGHMDTVDVKEGWNSDSFKPIVKNVGGREVLYGLGCNDMKAGIAVILAATARISPRGYRVKVAFGCDEEFYSLGAVRMLASGLLDDVQLIIVPEIGDFDRKTMSQAIVLGRMGRSEYLFQVKGRACHGAQSRVNQEAVNAVHESARLQQAVISHCSRNTAVFSSHGISIANSSYISYHHGGKATLSVPDAAHFILDRSFVMGEDMGLELSKLSALIDHAIQKGLVDPRAKVTVSEKPRPTRPCKPYFFPPSTMVVQAVTAIVDRITGSHEYGIGYSVADENRFAEKGMPCLTIGPRGGNSHAPQEWVDLESVRTLEKIYRAIAEEFPVT